MTDTTTCPSCNAPLPAGASFCTSCGHRLTPAEAAAPAAPAAPEGGADATRIETPGLHDSTQVIPAAEPAAPWQPAAADPAGGWGASPDPGAQQWQQPADPAAQQWQQPADPAAQQWQQPTDGQQWQQPAAAGGWQGADPAAQQWQQPAGTWPAAGEPATSGGAGAAEPSPLGGLAALAGGVLALAGTFMAWVEVTKNDAARIAEDTSLSLWSFASGDEVIKSQDPYLMVAFGVVALVAGVLLFTGKARPVGRLAAVAAGIAIIAVAVLDWNSISGLVSDDAAFHAAPGGKGAEVSTAIGFYLAIAGGVVAAAGAVLPSKKQP